MLGILVFSGGCSLEFGASSRVSLDVGAWILVLPPGFSGGWSLEFGAF
jgi:hypothetical protein